jgi:hypothetical protein
VGHAELPLHLEEVEVVHADELGVVDVDDLPVQDLLAERDPVGRWLRRRFLPRRLGAEHDRVRVHALHRRPGVLEAAAPGADDEALDRGVGLPGGGHEVGEPAQAPSRGVDDGATQEVGEEEKARVRRRRAEIGRGRLGHGRSRGQRESSRVYAAVPGVSTTRPRRRATEGGGSPWRRTERWSTGQRSPARRAASGWSWRGCWPRGPGHVVEPRTALAPGQDRARPPGPGRHGVSAGTGLGWRRWPSSRPTGSSSPCSSARSR